MEIADFSYLFKMPHTNLKVLRFTIKKSGNSHQAHLEQLAPQIGESPSGLPDSSGNDFEAFFGNATALQNEGYRLKHYFPS